MIKNTLIFLTLLLCSAGMYAQKVTGYVYDSKTSETLPGVNVSYKYKGETKGVLSDADGYYSIDVPMDAIMLTFSYVGYETQTCPLVIDNHNTTNQNIYLKIEEKLLNEVVVSAGRFEQKLSDITVSMDIIKPEDIERQSPKDLRSVLATVSGVDITDKQPSIRSGSGWTYGVGSRSLIMVDGMSILTPGIGEINWNVIPMENIEQVEVIKGASSVLYGSSALNGLINIRTKRPGIDPSTTVDAYLGIYGDPDNTSYRWWSKEFWKEGNYPVEPFLRKNVLYGVRNPIYTGLDFSHERRIGNFDVSGGMNIFSDEGYREGDYNKRLRVGGNLTYHDPSSKYLNYGFNVNFLSNELGDFFIWRSDKQPYMRSPLTNMAREANIFYIDPFFNYTNPNNNTSHKFKGRFYYKSDNISTNGTDKSLTEIARNMGVNNIDGLIKDPENTLREYWQKIGPNVLPSMLNNDWQGTIEGLEKSLPSIFPKATQADYIDLISWAMNHRPQPGQDLSQWLLDTVNPKKEDKGTDITNSYFADYQFSKKYETATLTSGMTYEHIGARSRITGNHNSDNIAGFFQYDDKFIDKLNLSLGVRFEYYRVDQHYREAETQIFGTKVPVKPVFRGGLNYQLAEYTFLRASFGQGYRYPSITEKYLVKDIGGVGAYPNKSLKPENGYNAEIGLKQAYKFGPFTGFIDVAGFYTRYKNMIEFDFGIIDPDPANDYRFITNLRDVVDILQRNQVPYIGVKFGNVSRAEIYGVDLSINGFCNINPTLKLIYDLGYVYTEPHDMDYKKRNAAEAANTDPFAMKSKSNTSKYLKYRQKNTAKASFDLQWDRFSVGTNMQLKSKTLVVDYFMLDERTNKTDTDVMDYIHPLLFGDLQGYWKEHNKDFFTMDFRVGVKVTKQVHLQCNINNLTNKEYSVRPMDISAPRTVVLKTSLKF